jgi:hypothetical protein
MEVSKVHEDTIRTRAFATFRKCAVVRRQPSLRTMLDHGDNPGRNPHKNRGHDL